jgi:hypothetical protein
LIHALEIHENRGRETATCDGGDPNAARLKGSENAMLVSLKHNLQPQSMIVVYVVHTYSSISLQMIEPPSASHVQNGGSRSLDTADLEAKLPRYERHILKAAAMCLRLVSTIIVLHRNIRTNSETSVRSSSSPTILDPILLILVLVFILILVRVPEASKERHRN